MSSITLKTIYELLGEKFTVPYYQRGYRWTKEGNPTNEPCDKSKPPKLVTASEHRKKKPHACSGLKE